jgi:hypothetical protein
MNKRIVDAILEAYTAGKPYLTPDMPDDMSVKLLCRFKLGDLRELAAGAKMREILSDFISSGVPGDEA